MCGDICIAELERRSSRDGFIASHLQCAVSKPAILLWSRRLPASAMNFKGNNERSSFAKRGTDFRIQLNQSAIVASAVVVARRLI